MADIGRALLADQTLSLDLAVEIEKLPHEPRVGLRLALPHELRHALGWELEARESPMGEELTHQLGRDRAVRRHAGAPLPPLRNPLDLVDDREQRVRVAEPLQERRPRARAAEEEDVRVHAAMPSQARGTASHRERR